MGEKLIAQTFSLRGATHEACDIDEGEPCRHHLARLCDRSKPVKARVGDGDLADIRLDGAERIIGGLGRRARSQRVEQGGLADIRQSDDAAFETHG